VSVQTVAERLVERLSLVASRGLPSPVRNRCEELLIDVAGLCVAARKSDYVQALIRSVDAGGPSTAIGHGGGFRPEDAAMINGSAAHGEDFDDTFEGGPVHSGAVIVPAVFAACERFGSQCIVVAIDAKRVGGVDAQGWEVYTHGGRTPTGLDAVEWARRMETAGAGEILLTSMDRDGTRKGFDLALTASISRGVSVPVIASGGADTPKDFLDVFTEGGADAALAASIFHDSIQGLGELKRFLASNGVPVRLH